MNHLSSRKDRLTLSNALINPADPQVRAEKEARAKLHTSYSRFLRAKKASKKEAAGKDLIRAIFGDDAI